MSAVILSTAWCDEHFDTCWFSYDEQTGITRHVQDYTTAKNNLEASGYYYAGHLAGTFRFMRRLSAPLVLPLDWQMALEAAQDHADADPYVEQDW